LDSPTDFPCVTREIFSNIVGGSGGPSFVYRKPFWQSAVFGVPADGKRDLPDASLFASNGFWNHAIIILHVRSERRGHSMQLFSTPGRVQQQRRRNFFHRTTIRQYPGAH
jgi:hypothetical protein